MLFIRNLHYLKKYIEQSGAGCATAYAGCGAKSLFNEVNFNCVTTQESFVVVVIAKLSPNTS